MAEQSVLRCSGPSLFTEGDGVKERNTAVGIYARTSSPNQRYNYSIDEQVSKCWDYCQTRGWTVRRVFVDECQGGGSIERANLQQMLARAEEGELDVIVFWKLDRFARSLGDLVSIEKSLRQRGVGLCSTTEFIDTTNSVGRFNYRNLASVAELEREIIGERARLGLYGLARQGRWPNHHPPLGYVVGMDGKLVVDQSEAKVVARIFSAYILEKSMPQLAFDLNKDGVKTKSGGRWNSRAIRDVLSNHIYIGRYSVAGFVQQIDEYRIVDDEVFEEAGKTMSRYEEGANRPPMPVERKLAKLDALIQSYKQFLGAAGNQRTQMTVETGDSAAACTHQEKATWGEGRESCKVCGIVRGIDSWEQPTLPKMPARSSNRVGENSSLSSSPSFPIECWIDECAISDQTERNFVSALEQVTTVGNQLFVPAEVLGKAADLLKVAFVKRLTKGRSVVSFCGSAFYLACRGSGHTRFTHEIAQALRVPEQDILASYRALVQQLETPVAPLSTKECVGRALELLGIGGQEREKALARLGGYANIEVRGSPCGIAGALTYIALGGEKTQKEISSALGITEATLRRIYKEMKGRSGAEKSPA
jgi:site-specific DNA recombinase